MAKKKKKDIEIVKKAKADKLADETKPAEKKADKTAKPAETDIPDLEEHTVEPVIKPQSKTNKSKGETKDDTKKPTEKPDRKADPGTVKKTEKTPKAGKERELAIPDRRRSEDKRRSILPPWWCSW